MNSFASSLCADYGGISGFAKVDDVNKIRRTVILMLRSVNSRGSLVKFLCPSRSAWAHFNSSSPGGGEERVIKPF